ncbi:hypothetical protein D3C87_2204830 [compost metagenome]
MHIDNFCQGRLDERGVLPIFQMREYFDQTAFFIGYLPNHVHERIPYAGGRIMLELLQ